MLAVLSILSGDPVLGQEQPSQPEGAGSPESASLGEDRYPGVAALPYQQVIRIARSDMNNDEEAEKYRLRIQSRLPGVKPADIELFLDTEKGPVFVLVDNEGFIEVPNSAALHAENPHLVSNQPKQTLNIFVDLELPKVTPPKIEDGKVAYRELFRPLIEIQEEMRKVDPTFGLRGRQQFVLEIETGEDPIKITRAFGTRTFRPNSRGKVYMVFESYLFEENPTVEIPDEIKMNVLPVSPEEFEDIRAR